MGISSPRTINIEESKHGGGVIKKNFQFHHFFLQRNYYRRSKNRIFVIFTHIIVVFFKREGENEKNIKNRQPNWTARELSHINLLFFS